MKLKCPRCKGVAEYGGYPRDPKLSTVLCLECGYAGPGAGFRRVAKARKAPQLPDRCPGCGKPFALCLCVRVD